MLSPPLDPALLNGFMEDEMTPQASRQDASCCAMRMRPKTLPDGQIVAGTVTRRRVESRPHHPRGWELAMRTPAFLTQAAD